LPAPQTAREEGRASLNLWLGQRAAMAWVALVLVLRLGLTLALLDELFVE
jgi:hypothetical protein